MRITINDGKIVNTTESAEVIIESATQTDFYNNAYIYPGFVDAHGHVFGLGTSLCSPRLHNSHSLAECLAILSDCKPNRGDWLTGYGWNEENWRCGNYPDKKYLDDLFPDFPVVMFRIDGHALWVNSKALAAAGISRGHNTPSGGEVKTDHSGNPTGILIDNAIYPVTELLPWYSDSQAKDIIGASLRELASAGITEVHDMDVSPNLVKLYKELDRDGKLPVRMQSFLQAQKDEYLQVCTEPYYGNKFNICGIKFYADGALGSRGAAFLGDYADRPGYKGLLLIDPDELYKKMKAGIERGFYSAIHAIGDAANRLAIEAYRMIRDNRVGGSSSILRIEHAQHIHSNDLPRFNKYNVFAAVQPVHCVSDAKMARKRIRPSQTKHYPWKSLLDKGATVAGGSDFPIESHIPLSGIDAFVNRIPFGENSPWMAEECISPAEAARAYTVTPHEFAGITCRGEIKPGYDADFVVLDNDITNNGADILKTKVLAVYCNGILTYKA